jgi:endonuclease-8
MPEGDTIHRTAAALRTAVLGKSLTAFEAPRLVGMRPSIGAVIERVESKGKHLEIGFDDGVVLHTHMRMSGSWHLYRAGEQWRKSARQARVIIEVPGWQAVCFSAPVVRTYRAKEFLPNPRLANLGPDLCLPDPDLKECLARIDRLVEPETTVAEVLLDQRIASGVGNVYKSEVLWLCELHPFTRIGALLPEQRLGLLAEAGRLLRSNLDRPNRVTVPGVPGGVAVYGRHAKPCPRCGTPIEVAKHGEQARVTYWCPGCQLFLPLAPPEDEASELNAFDALDAEADADTSGYGVDAGHDTDDDSWWPADPEPLDPPAATWDRDGGTDDHIDDVIDEVIDERERGQAYRPGPDDDAHGPAEAGGAAPLFDPLLARPREQ